MHYNRKRKHYEMAVKYLQDLGHKDAKPWDHEFVVDGDGYAHEVDGAAIASDCAVFLLHMGHFDSDRAWDARFLKDFIKCVTAKNSSLDVLKPSSQLILSFFITCSKHKEGGKGNVADFAGKAIIVAVTYKEKTRRIYRPKLVDEFVAKLDAGGILKWLLNDDYSLYTIDDPSQAHEITPLEADEGNSGGSGTSMRATSTAKIARTSPALQRSLCRWKATPLHRPILRLNNSPRYGLAPQGIRQFKLGSTLC